MPIIEPPSDEVLCRYLRMAKMIRKCVYIVADEDQWLPIGGDAPPRESASGEYYEVFPMGGRIQRCAVGTHAVLERIWRSDLIMVDYERQRAELIGTGLGAGGGEGRE